MVLKGSSLIVDKCTERVFFESKLRSFEPYSHAWNLSRMDIYFQSNLERSESMSLEV